MQGIAATHLRLDLFQWSYSRFFHDSDLRMQKRKHY